MSEKRLFHVQSPGGRDHKFHARQPRDAAKKAVVRFGDGQYTVEDKKRGKLHNYRGRVQRISRPTPFQQQMGMQREAVVEKLFKNK